MLLARLWRHCGKHNPSAWRKLRLGSMDLRCSALCIVWETQAQFLLPVPARNLQRLLGNSLGRRALSREGESKMTVAANYYPPDRGCRVSSTCLNCPLSACRYEDTKPYQAWLKEQGLPYMVMSNVEVEAEAVRLGVTTRTIWRRLRTAREAQ